MFDISVRGQAEARLTPTSATLVVTVRVGPVSTAAEAGQRAAQACDAVDAALAARRPDLVTGLVHLSVRTGQEWDHSPKGRRLLGWTATRTSEVECRPDGEGLTALLGELAGMKAVRLDGPRWVLAHDAEGLDEVRSRAAADARARAGAYAAGLGMAVGPVQRIAEPGVRGITSPEATAGMAMTRSAVRGPGGGEEEAGFVRVTVEPVRTEVTVEVTFALLEG